MICPKCGNEFEGTNCPKCDTPAILVNASDYERRKREWEEREKLKNQEEYRKRKNKEDVQRIAMELANTDYRNVISSKAGKFKAFAAKHKKGILAASVLIIAALAALLVGLKTAANVNMQIYISDGSSIYKGTSAGDKLCEAGELAYNRSNTKAHILNLPEQIDKDKMISSMCSDNDKYFAVVTYEEDGKSGTESTFAGDTIIGESDSTAVNGNALSEGTYTVYAWERNGDCFVVVSDKKEKTLQNISVSGILTFTDTEYMNEGVIRSVSLCAADIAGGSPAVLYSDNVSEFLMTSEYCIWLETDGVLYAGIADRNISSELSLSSVRIAGNIKRIYSGVQSGVYSHQNACLQPDEIQSFIYETEDGEFIYSDISNINKINHKYLFMTQDTITDIVYEIKYGCAYVFSRNTLIRFTGIPIKDKSEDTKERSVQTVENILSSKDFFYIENSRTLYFVNENGVLVKISPKNKNNFERKEILVGVSKGTLDTVYGTPDGFLCRTANALYYVYSGRGKTVMLMENISQKDPVFAVFYNKQIYYLLQGNLYCASTDKGGAQEIGQAREIWIGRVFLE